MNQYSHEDLENWRKKLIFRSWHRGTKEMDLLLGSFADLYVSGFDLAELQEYERILEFSDPDLYNWMTGQEALPANDLGNVFQKLLQHRFKV